MEREMNILSNEFAPAILQDLCLRQPYSGRIRLLYLSKLKVTYTYGLAV